MMENIEDMDKPLLKDETHDTFINRLKGSKDDSALFLNTLEHDKVLEFHDKNFNSRVLHETLLFNEPFDMIEVDKILEFSDDLKSTGFSEFKIGYCMGLMHGVELTRMMALNKVDELARYLHD